MSEAVSCGGVVIFRGKVLVLYKNFMNSRDGWVLPKGTVEKGETYEQTAVREVNEEAGADVRIRAYIGSTNYSFKAGHKNIDKIVHWYLCESDSYDCMPQKEEFFYDAGYYKYHEAYHLLEYPNEKQILSDAYTMYRQLRKEGNW